jgi:hypothetical protein
MGNVSHKLREEFVRLVDLIDADHFAMAHTAFPEIYQSVRKRQLKDVFRTEWFEVDPTNTERTLFRGGAAIAQKGGFPLARKD